MSTQSTYSSTRLRFLGEPDPQLPARLLALLTCRNQLPIEFRLQRAGGDSVLVEMRVPYEGADAARRLLEKALKIPSVLSASLTHVRRTVAAPAVRLRA